MTPLEHAVIGIVTLAVVAAVVLGIGQRAARYRAVAGLLVVATFGLVVLGAFVRLSDAGLGCPDWPGCYGALSPVHAYDVIAERQAADPDGPVSHEKAWKEMVHRYLASFVGACTFALAIAALRNRRRWGRSPWLAVAIFGIACLQGAFGAWTVTMQLRPIIVTGHLIGGLLTLSLLVLLRLSTRDAGRDERMRPVFGGAARPSPGLRALAALGLVVVITQILLGGWVSTNYAALACPDFPSCRGALLPALDVADAFDLTRRLGLTAAGAPLPSQALVTIHWVHRVFAIVVALTIATLAWRLRILAATRAFAWLLGLVLLAQLALGIGNVLLQLPLPVAVAHNAGAALLLVLLVALNHRLVLCARSSGS